MEKDRFLNKICPIGGGWVEPTEPDKELVDWLPFLNQIPVEGCKNFLFLPKRLLSRPREMSS